VRVLHLQLTDGPVEIHPYVTVLRGSSPAARQELLDVFAALPGGRALVPGVIEAHGVLLDLTAGSLAMLDLNHELDTVVRRTDLPHGDGARAGSVADARQRLDEARAQLATAEASLTAAVAARDEILLALERLEGAGATEPLAAGPPPSTEPDTERSRFESAAARVAGVQERARQALAAAEDEAILAGEAHAAALARLAATESALEAASERRDPTAAAAVEAARRRVAEAEGAVAAATAGEADFGAVGGSIEQVKEERMALEAALLALETVDPLPVRLALNDLESSRRVALVPSTEAEQLADRWAILLVDLDRLGARAYDDGPDAVERRAAARRRLVQAETEVARMEAAIRGPVLDPDDVAELERAHEEVLEARDAAEKRFGGVKAVQRLEEAMAAEEAVLARLGFVSWADFRLGAPSASVATDEELAARLALAQRELRDAQTEHHALEASIDAELFKAEALDRRRLLRLQVNQLLGYEPTDDDMESALRRHRVTVEDTGGHLARLRSALDSAGLVLDGEDLDQRVLTDLATMWLKEQADTEQRRTALEGQLAEVDVRLAQLQASEHSGAGGEPVASASAVLDDARRALAAAEARASADAAATSTIDHLRQAFERASQEEREVAHRVARADEQGLAAAAMLRAADDEVRRAVETLAGIDRADDAAAAAAADRAELLAQVEAAGGDVSALEEALEDAYDAVDDAREVYAERGRQVGDALAALAALEAAAARAAAAPDDEGADAGDDEHGGAEDLEWYLLARLAAQRSVSFAGSVPLVLDDTLAGLDAASTHRVLERLERMAATVQLVILTEDLSAASWAESLGTERALVVQQ
jgi:hypothetical protein